MAARDRFITLDSKLYRYVVAHGHNDDPVLEELADETARLGPIGGMQISPEQGTLMTSLARAIGARSAIELGTFTGYSAICVARGLPPDGRLLCCDVSEEWTAIALRYRHKAGDASERSGAHRQRDLGRSGDRLEGPIRRHARDSRIQRFPRDGQARRRRDDSVLGRPHDLPQEIIFACRLSPRIRSSRADT